MASHTQSHSFLAGFRTEEIHRDGKSFSVQVGGSGPAVLLLHGSADATEFLNSAWSSAATELYEENTVLIPDPGQAELSELDILWLLNQFEIERIDLVTRDRGNSAGFAFASQFPNRVKRWVVIGNWEKPEVKEKLSMPILAVGSELKSIASRVEGAAIPLGDAHATTRMIVNFLGE